VAVIDVAGELGINVAVTAWPSTLTAIVATPLSAASARVQMTTAVPQVAGHWGLQVDRDAIVNDGGRGRRRAEAFAAPADRPGFERRRRVRDQRYGESNHPLAVDCPADRTGAFDNNFRPGLARRCDAQRRDVIYGDPAPKTRDAGRVELEHAAGAAVSEEEVAVRGKRQSDWNPTRQRSERRQRLDNATRCLLNVGGVSVPKAHNPVALIAIERERGAIVCRPNSDQRKARSLVDFAVWIRNVAKLFRVRFFTSREGHAPGIVRPVDSFLTPRWIRIRCLNHERKPSQIALTVLAPKDRTLLRYPGTVPVGIRRIDESWSFKEVGDLLAATASRQVNKFPWHHERLRVSKCRNQKKDPGGQ
jgi:hypothetical protein